MTHLQESTKEKIEPLFDCLQNIENCVITQQAVALIEQILKLNREVSMAISQEDSIEKAVNIISKKRNFIKDATMMNSSAEKLDRMPTLTRSLSDDHEIMCRFLDKFSDTLGKVVERINYKV
jgi:hypothetical protein